MAARVAVVGCGWWATEAHLPSLIANPDAEVAAVVEPDPERRALAVEHFGVPAGFESVDDLLASVEVDCAIVAAPHHLHHALAAPLLDAGVHVLVEKPMTIAPADAHDLVSRAHAASVQLLVGYPWHYNPQSAAAAAAIAEGRIGEIELVQNLFASIARELYHGRPATYDATLGYSILRPKPSTYSDPRYAGGGQGQTQVTHSAALLLWLTGLQPAAVAAFTEGFELPMDLADAVSVRFSSGAIGTLASTGGVKQNLAERLEYRIFGSDGHIVFDVLEGELSIHDVDGVEHLPTVPETDRYPQQEPARNLVDVVLGRAPNRSSGELGARVVELVDAMYRSQRERATVELKGQ